MHDTTLRLSLEVLLAIITLASMGLLVVVTRAALRQLGSRQMGARSDAPSSGGQSVSGISILKPISGCDDGLWENLESFASLAGAPYELLLGLSTPADPALPLLRRFLVAHPQLKAAIIFTNPRAAYNPKVAQLIGLGRQAAHPVLVVSDSNVRVPANYLQDIVQQFSAPNVGLVSHLVVGTGANSLGSLIDNYEQNARLTAYVAASAQHGARPGIIGKSIAIHADTLRSLGGWSAFGKVLAEDDLLGERVAQAGFNCRLGDVSVESVTRRADIKRSFARHRRWAVIRRKLNPGMYLLEPLAQPVVPALLWCAVAPSNPVTWTSLFIAQNLSGACAALMLVRTRGPLASWVSLLEPLRLAFSVSTWLAGWWGSTITWRGNTFQVGRDTRLYPVRNGLTGSRRRWRFRPTAWVDALRGSAALGVILVSMSQLSGCESAETECATMEACQDCLDTLGCAWAVESDHCEAEAVANPSVDERAAVWAVQKLLILDATGDSATACHLSERQSRPQLRASLHGP
jgi:ceramide glucosyltransferase